MRDSKIKNSSRLPETGYVTRPLLRASVLLNGYVQNAENIFYPELIEDVFCRVGRKLDLERNGMIEDLLVIRRGAKDQTIGYGRHFRFEWKKLTEGSEFIKARRVSMMLPKHTNLMDVAICWWIARNSKSFDNRIVSSHKLILGGVETEIDILDPFTPVTTDISFKWRGNRYHITVRGVRNHRINRRRRSNTGRIISENQHTTQVSMSRAESILKQNPYVESLVGDFSSDMSSYKFTDFEPEL